MKKTNKILKSLLTTASAMAVLAGGVQGAAAAARTVTGNNAILNTGAGLDGGAAFVNGSDLTLTGGFNFSAGAAKTIASVNLATFNSTFTVDAVVTLGAVDDTGVGNNGRLAVVINNGETLTLNGTASAYVAGVAANQYRGLGNITLGSGGGGLGTLTFKGTTPLAALTGTIDSNVAAVNGVINVDNSTVIFNGTIGAVTGLGTINIGDANGAGVATFANTVKSTNIEVGGANDGTATFGGIVTATDLEVGTAGGGVGTVTFDNATSTITNTTFNKAGSSVTIGNGNATKITGDFNFNNTASTITLNGTAVELAKIDGNVDSTGGANGTLLVNGSGQITGTVGTTAALTAITVGNGANGTATFDNAVGATTINIGNGVFTGTATFANTVNATNIYVGSAGNAAGTVTFNGNVTSNIMFKGTGVSSITAANGVVIDGAVDAAGAATNTSLIFSGAGEVTSVIGATTALNLVKANGAGTVKIDAASKATTFQITNAGATFEIADTVVLTGNVDATVVGGNLIFSGDGTVSGTIGATNPMNLTATDQKTLILNGNSNVGTLIAPDTAPGNTKIQIANGKSLTLSQASTFSLQVIRLGDATSTLGFSANGDSPIFTLTNELGANIQGKVALSATNATDVLTLSGGTLKTSANTALAEINVTGAGQVKLNSAINTAALNVGTGGDTPTLTVTDASALANATNPLTTVDTGATYELLYNGATNIQNNAGNIVLAGANPTLKLSATGGAANYTVQNNLAPTAGGGNGTIQLNSVGASTVTLTDAGGKIGNGADFATLLVTGGAQSTLDASVAGGAFQAIKIAGSGNTVADSSLLVQGGTITNLTPVTLGGTNLGGVVTSTFTDAVGLVLDALNTNVAVNAVTFTATSFGSTNASVKFQNTGAGNSAFTLGSNLTPSADASGTVAVNTAGGPVTLAPGGGPFTIGTGNGAGIAGVNNRRFNTFNVSGGGVANITTDVFAKTINITNTGATTFGAAVDTGAGGTLATAGAGAINIDANFAVDTITGGGTLTLGNNVVLSNSGAGGTYAANLTSNAIVGTPVILGTNTTDTTLSGNITGGAGFYKLANGVTTVNGNIAANDISAVTASNASLVLGGANATVTSTLGVNGKLQAVKLNGTGAAVINAAPTFSTGELDLAMTGATPTASVLGVNFAGIAVKNTGGTPQTLIVGGVDVTFDTNSTLAATDTVKVNGNGNLNITTANFAANIQPTNTGNVTVNLAGGGNYNKIGTSAAKVATLNFTSNSSVTEAHATTVTVAAGQTGTFNGTGANTIDATNLTLTGQANFVTGSAIPTTLAVDGAAPGPNNPPVGKIQFTGATTIGSALGGANGLAAVNFVDNNPIVTGNTPDLIALNSGIKATTIGFMKTPINVGPAVANVPVTLAGGTTFAGSTINLGANNLTLATGPVTFTGTTTVNTTVAVANANATNGQLIVNTGANAVTLAEGNTLNFALTGVPTDFNGNITLIQNAGSTNVVNDGTLGTTGVTFGKVQILNNGNVIYGSVTQTPDTADETLEEEIASAGFGPAVSSDAIAQIATAITTNPGSQIYNIFNTTTNGVTSAVDFTAANIADTVARLVNTINAPANDAINTTVNTVTSGISSRIGSLVSFTPAAIRVGDAAPVSGQISGMSAGDDASMYGVWGSPVYAASTQKTYGNFAGYSAKSVGGTIGFDAKVMEEAIVGAAISLVNTKSKYKGFKSGDKTSMDSTLFSIYGMYQFTNEAFVQGVATYANTRVKNNESRRVSNTAFQNASGKYTAKSFNIEAMVGYNYMVSDQFAVTPMIGLEYTNNQSSKYTESGTTNQNMKINVKANQKVEGIAGIKLSGMSYDMNGIEVSPEVHGFIRQDLTNKAVKVNTQTTLDNSLNITNSTKTAKTRGNIGVSVNAKQGMMEYGIGYDLNLAKKFVGNQGSLKLRVNF